MPTYEYKCDQCGDIFEIRQKFADAPLTSHEKCGGPVHRLISAPGLQFKGTGWYVTDYARPGSREEKKPESSKSETKADSNGSKSSSTESSSSETAATKSGDSSTTKSESKPSDTTKK